MKSFKAYLEKTVKEGEEKGAADYMKNNAETAKETLENIEGMSDEDIEETEEFEEWCEDSEDRYEIPASFCPLCSFESVDLQLSFNYLLSKTGLTEKQLLKELKEKFTSFKEFKDCNKKK